MYSQIYREAKSVGKDNRENKLEHLFKREIHKRIEDDMQSTKKYHNFPHRLLYVL